MIKRLAKVTDAYISLSDGTFSCWIALDYHDAGMQSFGGYDFSEYDKKLKERKGTASGADFILSILRLFRVSRFEQIKNRTVFAILKNDSHAGFILGLEIPTFDGGGYFLIPEWRIKWGLEVEEDENEWWLDKFPKKSME